MKRNISSVAGMAGLMVLAQTVALLMAIPFIEAELQVFEDPESVATPIWYFMLIIIVTAVILLMVKLRKRNIIKHVILFAFGLTLLMVFDILFILALSQITSDIPVISWVSFISAIVVAAGLTFLLYRFPEWYVVDFVGVFVAAAVAAILGISLAILPVFVLLIILAVYDAISVYKTKHMITLADAVTMERLPVLLVVPTTKGYSFLKQKSIKEQIKKKEKRDAVFMGLGDIAIPTILAVSAFSYLPTKDGLFTFSHVLVAIVTLVGCMIGFLILMRFVMKGNPQAGLPLLNGGAIAGYLLSYLIFFPGDFTFGFIL
jgi:presenilin-like A22 family membrane protease